jgi:hypothetical protein
MTTMRDHLLANKENEACQEEMDALLVPWGRPYA